MGIVQHRHIFVHSMCWRSSFDGRAHIKSETLENGPMGRFRIGAHERSWQLQGTSQIRTTCTRLLSTSMRRWSTVSFYPYPYPMYYISYFIFIGNPTSYRKSHKLPKVEPKLPGKKNTANRRKKEIEKEEDEHRTRMRWTKQEFRFGTSLETSKHVSIKHSISPKFKYISTPVKNIFLTRSWRAIAHARSHVVHFIVISFPSMCARFDVFDSIPMYTQIIHSLVSDSNRLSIDHNNNKWRVEKTTKNKIKCECVSVWAVWCGTVYRFIRRMGKRTILLCAVDGRLSCLLKFDVMKKTPKIPTRFFQWQWRKEAQRLTASAHSECQR